MTPERLFNSFIPTKKTLYPPKQISGYAPGSNAFAQVTASIAVENLNS